MDEYTSRKMAEIVAKFNELEGEYDTRLLAALMAGRAGMLHGALINSGLVSQEEARHIWDVAGDPIENPPERETKVVKMFEGLKFDGRVN